MRFRWVILAGAHGGHSPSNREPPGRVRAGLPELDHIDYPAARSLDLANIARRYEWPLAAVRGGEEMPKSPYRIARQEHLGNMLDHLQGLGLLTWEWGYESHSAVYWVTEIGHQIRKLDTRRAELLALKLCKHQGIIWLP